MSALVWRAVAGARRALLAPLLQLQLRPTLPRAATATAALPAPAVRLERRSYAKKGGSKGKEDDGAASKPDLRAFDLKPLEGNVKKSVEQLGADLRALRVGAASPNLLDSVNVTAYDKTVPLSQIAQISVRDAQTLWVAIFDAQLLEPAATAIRNSSLGLNPITDKNALRVPIPKMTAEHRDNLVKLVTKEGEKAKAAVRNHRHTVLKDLKKVGEGASQDDVKRLEKSIQKVVDDATKTIDGMLKTKTTEIQQR